MKTQTKYIISPVESTDEEYQYVTDDVYDTLHPENVAIYEGARFYRFEAIPDPDSGYGAIYFGQYKDGKFFLGLENRDWLTHDLKEIIDAMIDFITPEPE